MSTSHDKIDDSRERSIGTLHVAALYAAAQARFVGLELCRLIDLVEDGAGNATIAARLRDLADMVDAGISHDD